MRIGILFSIIIFSFVFLATRPAAADSAVSKMAGMLIHLKHHPTDMEKKELQKIIKDKSIPENERVIAAALMNMNHEVSAPDQAKLKAVRDDKSTPVDAKELADILMYIHHKPTEDDQVKLKKLMQ
jgi:hypothetical protein